MKNKFTRLVLIFALIELTAKAQTVNIPDANFKAALVSSVTINTNADSEIQLSEAITYTGAIHVNSLSIASLTGIEAFTSLTGLTCSYNQITGLNVSSNPALAYIYCDHNQLTSLVLSGANALGYLYCGFNQLTSLDLHSNPAVATLYCWNNQLTSINVTGLTALTELYCHNNQLTTLNLSTNTALDKIWANDNPFMSLDLSANSNLTWVQCGNSPLTGLNMKNGNNSNLTHFSAMNTPSLICVQVDDATYMSNFWSGAIDPFTFYSTSCVADIPVMSTNTGILIYPSPSAGIVTIETDHLSDMTIGVYDLVGKCIYEKHTSAISSQSIDISNASKGIYFVKVIADDHQSIKKMVIQ